MKLLEDILHYSYVGVIPNAIATLCVTTAITNASEGNYAGAIYNTAVAGLNYFIGWTKFKEYQEVHSALDRHGWDERLVKPKMYSWCQRHAAGIAAKEHGHEEAFRAYALRENHKWYHLLPKLGRAVEEL